MTPLQKRLRRKYTRVVRNGVCKRVVLKAGWQEIKIEYETTLKDTADVFRDRLAEALARIVEEEGR